MTITITGGDKLISQLGNLSDEVKEAISKALEITGVELRGEIVKGYQRGPATGIIYEKYNPRRTHQASAEGEAPMSDGGRLAPATIYERVGPLSVQVSNSVFYGPILEYNMNRPLWVPESEKAAPKMRARIEAAINKATK